MSFKENFLSNLKQVPDPYHFTQYAKTKLIDAGFVELKESDEWKEIPKRFFVIRDNRTILAMKKESLDNGVFLIVPTDFPAFKNKPNSNRSSSGLDLIDVSPQGSGTLYSWFDRDIRLSGRLFYKDGGTIKSKLFTTESIGFTPMLSKALQRYINFELRIQDDFDIVINNSTPDSNNCIGNVAESVAEVISESADIPIDSFFDADFYLINGQEPSIIGIEQEFVKGQGLTAMTSALTGLESFLESKDPINGFTSFIAFDNEAIGATILSSDSIFIPTLLERIGISKTALSNSVAIFSRGVQGSNPNNRDSIEALIGKGPAIFSKSTSLFARPVFFNAYKAVKELNVPYQEITAKDGDFGKATLNLPQNIGNPSHFNVGIPILSRNSIRETAHIEDIESLQKLVTKLIETFSSS